MRRHLNERGFKYILCGLNPNNHDMFWVFERTDKLNKVVEQWFNSTK
jgi:hypothetical protein